MATTVSIYEIYYIGCNEPIARPHLSYMCKMWFNQYTDLDLHNRELRQWMQKHRKFTYWCTELAESRSSNAFKEVLLFFAPLTWLSLLTWTSLALCVATTHNNFIVVSLLNSIRNINEWIVLICRSSHCVMKKNHKLGFYIHFFVKHRALDWVWNENN